MLSLKTKILQVTLSLSPVDSEKYFQFQVRAHIRAELLVVFQGNYGNADSLRNVVTPSAGPLSTSPSTLHRHPLWASTVRCIHPQIHCVVFLTLAY